MKGIVINPFRDIHHFNTLYNVGDIVDFDKERMQDLFNRNLCKKYKEQEATPAPLKDEKVKVEAPKVAEAETEVGESVLEEKAKSEQEAAEKIAKATRRMKKTI